jgi:hypothetical protein
MIELWMPERGAIALLDEQGKQTLWVRSRLDGVWRPNDAYLDQWWKLVGRQEE